MNPMPFLSLYRFMKRMKRFHSSGFVRSTTAEMPDGLPPHKFGAHVLCSHTPLGIAQSHAR